MWIFLFFLYFSIILHLFGPDIPSLIHSSFIFHLNDEVKAFQRYGIYRMLFQSLICGLLDNTGSVRCHIYDTYSLFYFSCPNWSHIRRQSFEVTFWTSSPACNCCFLLCFLRWKFCHSRVRRFHSQWRMSTKTPVKIWTLQVTTCYLEKTGLWYCLLPNV